MCEGKGGGCDILWYYARYYRDGVVDLSSSSPAPSRLVAAPGLVHSPSVGYVPPTGAPELRTRIAALYDSLSPDDIVLASGASEALVALAHSLVSPGDTVLSDRGTYPSFTAAVRRIGARAVSWCDGSAASLVSICNPTVPDGRLCEVLPRARLECPVIVDECHLDVVHTDDRPARAADTSPYHVSVSGLSKNLGFAGLRVGWLATRDPNIRSRVDRELQLLSGGPSSLSVEAALHALDEYESRVAAVRCQAAQNAPRIFELLEDLGWCYRRPDAGLTLEVRPPCYVPPANESHLRERGYFLVPCCLYGTAGAYRISLLAPADHLRIALEALVPSG